MFLHELHSHIFPGIDVERRPLGDNVLSTRQVSFTLNQTVRVILLMKVREIVMVVGIGDFITQKNVTNHENTDCAEMMSSHPNNLSVRVLGRKYVLREHRTLKMDIQQDHGTLIVGVVRDSNGPFACGLRLALKPLVENNEI